MLYFSWASNRPVSFSDPSAPVCIGCMSAPQSICMFLWPPSAPICLWHQHIPEDQRILCTVSSCDPRELMCSHDTSTPQSILFLLVTPSDLLCNHDTSAPQGVLGCPMQLCDPCVSMQFLAHSVVFWPATHHQYPQLPLYPQVQSCNHSHRPSFSGL